MRKKYILKMVLLSWTALFLVACGSDTDVMVDEAEAVDKIVTEVSEAADEIVTEALETADDSMEESASEITIEPTGPQSISELYQEIMKLEDEDTFFGLAYLNDDEIPELVAYNSYFSTYTIYTVEKGIAVCLVDTVYSVEMTYYERKGVVSIFARWNGGGDEGGYGSYDYLVSADREPVMDESVPTICLVYDAVYNENGEYSGFGITKYYCLGEPVDEETYRNHFDDLGLVAGEDILFTFADKDEILAQLDAMTE